MNELELCKAIADIEGLDNEQQDALHRLIIGKGSTTGKALLLDLIFKYDVDITPSHWYVSIDQGSGYIEYNSKDELPRAILECIVEANQ